MSTHATIKEDALQTAREWMKKHIVIDGLGGGPTGEGFIKDLQGGGVSAMNWTVAGAGSSPKAAFMNMLNRKWLVRRVPDKCTIVHSAAEIEKARAEGKVAIIHGWQGAEALARAKELLGENDAIEEPELVVMELYEANAALGAITGQISSEEVLADIFSRFCVGK